MCIRSGLCRHRKSLLIGYMPCAAAVSKPMSFLPASSNLDLHNAADAQGHWLRDMFWSLLQTVIISALWCGAHCSWGRQHF